MGVFDLDSRGQDALAEEAQLNPIGFDQIGTGALSGIGTGIGTGIMRGGARVGQFLGMAGAAPLSLYERWTDQEGRFTDPYFRGLDATVNNAVDYWTPNHAEVGTIGQVLGGFSEIALPLMAGGGNPVLLTGAQGMGLSTDLARQGVDAPTAVGGGLLQAASTAVGFKLPFLGKTLTSRIATGAGGNLLLNAGTTAAQQALFSARGYEDLAAQYDPFDIEARAVDILTGIAFGSIAHLQAPRPMRASDRAAVAAAANAKHFQRDTMPGAPGDIGAQAAHQQAMETAIDQLLKGEPVAVPPAVVEAEFTPRDTSTTQRARVEAARDEGLPEAPADGSERIPLADSLAPESRAIETRFRQQIGGDVDAAMAAYEKLPDSQGGKVLNTDVARELSADYLKDRSQSAAVHEPASWLVKKMYERKLAEAPKPGEEPLVIFSAGGTGAGKTSGLGVVQQLVDQAQLIYDTNMNKLSSAVQKIDQALAAGKEVSILYTYRDPVEALTGGALPRAARQEGKYGSGRTVPLAEHVGTHVGSRRTIEQIAAHYAGDPRVEIQVVDNSRGKGKQQLAALRDIPQLDEKAYNELRGKALEALDAELASGRISAAVHRGFAEGEPRNAARGPHEADRSPGGGEPAQGVARERVDDPLTEAVRASLIESDLLVPTGEIDPAGNPISRSAREVMAEADQSIVQAETDGRGIMAAVTCAMQRGEG